ncbi:MAG: DoxX family protein [Burkholderiales bacterium]
MTSASATLGADRGRATTVVLWVLQILAAAMFLFAGSMKLISQEETVRAFGVIGLGQWFRYFTAALEVSGAIMLLIPRLAGAGALLLMVVMTGAIATHLFIIGGSPAGAVLMLAINAYIAWNRRREVAALLGA